MKLGRILSAALPLIKAVAPPHVHLYDLDGSMYMGRWSVIDEFKRINGRDTQERTWSSKMLEKLTGYCAIRLHWIRRIDHDRDLHNHPFEYRTFVLKGWYTEEFDRGVHDSLYHFIRTMTPGDTAVGGANHYHRIANMPDEGVWTLFCMTRNTTEWGFKVNGCHVTSRRYFRMRGYRKANRSNGKVGV